MDDDTSPAVRRQLERRSSKSYLQQAILGDFITPTKEGGASKKSKLIFARKTTAAREALTMLSKSRIVSIPVWDEATKEFVAFLSVVDIFPYSMDSSRSLCPGSSQGPTLGDILKELGDDEGIQVDVFARSSPVSTIMEWFTLGIHRVLVEDADAPPNTPLAHVVSQSDIVRYLYEHVDRNSAVCTMTLQEHHLLDDDTPSIGPGRISPITPETTAADGFKKLLKDRTSAVPIVDSAGKLLGSLSESDFRGVPPGDIGRLLALPAMQFISRQRSPKPFTCRAATPLLEVMGILCENGVHRVWVVNDDGSLKSVITLTDVLCKFAPFDYKLLHSKRI